MDVTRRGLYAIAVLTAVILMVLALSRTVAVEAAYPFERAVSLFSRYVGSRIIGCFTGAEARAENVRLRRDLGALSMLRGDIERLEKENAELRKAMDFPSRISGNWLGAEILSRDGGAAGAGHTLRLCRGSLDGVKEGAPVAAPEGLVGTVVGVTPHTCEVRTIVNASIMAACEVESLPGALTVRGITCGGGDRLVVRHLRNLEMLDSTPPRSRVMTSGLGGVFPRGIEIGLWLGTIVAEDGNIAGEILPGVDFESLDFVFIRREK